MNTYLSLVEKCVKLGTVHNVTHYLGDGQNKIAKQLIFIPSMSFWGIWYLGHCQEWPVHLGISGFSGNL